MTWPTIAKSEMDSKSPPNLRSYEIARREFNWEQARGELAGLPNGQGLNIAYEAVDRHAIGVGGKKTAIRWLSKEGQAVDPSYKRLLVQTNRFVNVLEKLGACKGDRVYVLAGRIPELYIAEIGALKAECVICPLLSAFGPEPIRARLAIGE